MKFDKLQVDGDCRGMDESYGRALQLRAEIEAVKVHLTGLYAERTALMKVMTATMTTRQIAVAFNVKQPLVVNTINGRRGAARADR